MDDLDKIRSDELRSAADAGGAEVHTVIVELNVPLPRISSSKPSPGRPSNPIRFEDGEPNGVDANAIREEIAKGVRRPVGRYMATSRAMVVDATGRELREIARLPGVSAIWPNRRLK